MSMGIEFYINGSTWYGPPWYSFLIMVFIFLIIIFGSGFMAKLVISFLRERKDRIREEKKI